MEQNIKYIPNNRFNVKLLNQSNPNHDGHDLCYNGVSYTFITIFLSQTKKYTFISNYDFIKK
jgi:hypothetical protein